MRDLVEIQSWALETFGMPTPESAYLKVMEEVGELAVALREKNSLAAAHEVADIIITLAHLTNALNCSVGSAVESKMQINLERKWKKRLDGTGDHI